MIDATVNMPCVSISISFELCELFLKFAPAIGGVGSVSAGRLSPVGRFRQLAAVTCKHDA
jgi:hypothetical protein